MNINYGYTEEQKQVIREVLQDCLDIKVERAYPGAGSRQAVRVKVSFAGEVLAESESNLW